MSNSTTQNNSENYIPGWNSTLTIMFTLIGLYLVYVIIKLKIKIMNQNKIINRNNKWFNKSWKGKRIIFPLQKITINNYM